MSKFQISLEQVKNNIAALKAFMAKENLDAFYVSSFDPFLNEYVPMENCHRYYLSGFNGSTAEVLVPADGRVKLYVDGRYHEQADLEVDASDVEVVKVPQNTSNTVALVKDLKDMKAKNVGCESDRTSLALFQTFTGVTEVKPYGNKELESVIDFTAMPDLAPIKGLSSEVAGTKTSEKLKRVIADKAEAFFVTAIDSLAWVTNCRGYHLPNLSSFLGRGLVTHDRIYVYIDEGTKVECNDELIEFIPTNAEGMKAHLIDMHASYNFKNIYFDERMINAQDFGMIESVFGKSVLKQRDGGLVEFHSVKEAGEIKAIKESFVKADKAIFNTIKWVKENIAKGESVSELDLYNQTTVEYQKQGAVEQSFGTIAGVGANGSIIHYSDPKSDVMINEDSMVLLDSGGYFESGFATDTTRTFMGANKDGNDEFKKIYTLVLKGTLSLQNAVFKAGTRGGGLDAICRQPLYQAGYEFAHGTGHGVGIHVHEGGVGIGPTRNYLLQPGQVVSIEPGIYISGFGGVRLENIGLIVEHPKYEGFLTFESLVYIGFEPHLIDESLLSDQEKTWLKEYEAECEKRGTSFLV